MRQRVFIYLTRGQQLLVLRYVDGRYLAPQIPGGTLRPDETPAAAALREAQEETGLSALEVVRCLGHFTRDLTDIGRDETIVAWFFHLRTEQATPDSWRHLELDPSEGGDPIEFELSWVPLHNLPELGGIDACMLNALHASLNGFALVGPGLPGNEHDA